MRVQGGKKLGEEVGVIEGGVTGDGKTWVDTRSVPPGNPITPTSFC